MEKLNRIFINNVKNIPGRSTGRKMVAIMCDDWGGIRIPSARSYDHMIKKGLPLDDSRYTKYDTLADKDDLELLFEILTSVKDKNGKPAVMSPVCNVANPDFERIKGSGYTRYYYEPFTRTLERYGREPGTFALWQKGTEEGIFVPELHGREHITVQLWMKKLQGGNKQLLEAFDYGFVALDVPGIPGAARQFRPEFFFGSPDQIPYLHESIKTSVELFKDIFGYLPASFVPANGIFHPVFEASLEKAGVKYLSVHHIMPVSNGKGGIKKNLYLKPVQVKKSLSYYTRNCVFEPNDTKYQGIEYTLNQIEAAFRWRKPAIISTHRVNFIGGISRNNRARGLTELRKLLSAIIKKFPCSEFVSSGDMLESIFSKREIV